MLSNQWKIGICIGGIVFLYIIFLFVQDTFVGFYYQHTYSLAKPIEADTECLKNPPTAELKIQECKNYRALASQWIWWLALKSTIASYWICETLFCAEHHQRLRKWAIQLFGFCILSIICTAIYIILKRRWKTSATDDLVEEKKQPQPIMYNPNGHNAFVMMIPQTDIENYNLSRMIKPNKKKFN